MQMNIIQPMKLTVSTDDARKLIGQIPHSTCRRAAERHWSVNAAATVPEESVNWLYCWAKTGMGSPTAAEEARHVFDAILPVTFLQYDRMMNHEYARAHRYFRENGSREWFPSGPLS